MIDASDFLGPDPDADDLDDEAGGGTEAADFIALKDCLQALADAIASTNLAVVSNSLGDNQGAGARVQASVAALKRFHDAFVVLKGDETEEGEDE